MLAIPGVPPYAGFGISGGRNPLDNCGLFGFCDRIAFVTSFGFPGATADTGGSGKPITEGEAGGGAGALVLDTGETAASVIQVLPFRVPLDCGS
jgi:hypothetical protein